MGNDGSVKNRCAYPPASSDTRARTHLVPTETGCWPMLMLGDQQALLCMPEQRGKFHKITINLVFLDEKAPLTSST